MLDINPLLMGLVFVLFILSIFLFNSWLFKPLVAFMDDRSNSIRSDVGEISANEHEVKSILKESEDILDNARREASHTKEVAYNEAKKVVQSQIEARQKEIDGKMALFNTEMGIERVELKNSLLSQAPLFKESLKAKISRL